MSEWLSFHLSDDFVGQYKKQEPPWGLPVGGGNSLAELTFIAKYSRLKEDGSKERWFETCRRCVEGMYSILKDHCKYQRTPWNENKAQKSAQDAYDRMFRFLWTPPGRGLATMGTEFVHREVNNASLNNCFSADTRFITSEGFRSFRETEGQTVTILTSKGSWSEGTVSSFGEQELWELILRRSGKEKRVLTTSEHRWFVRDKRQIGRVNNLWKEVLTKDIKDFHQVRSVFGQGIRGNVYPSAQGLAHGICYGDGTSVPGEKNANRLRLCGEKNRSLLKFFSESRTLPLDDDIQILDLPNYYKSLPSIKENKSYLYGWLSGYFAADGTVDKGGSPSMESCKRSDVEFYREVCSVLGIGTHMINEFKRISNLTNEESVIYSTTLILDTLTPEFFLIQEHRDRVDDRLKNSRHRSNEHFSIVSVKNTHIVEKVFCLTVPSHGNFVLEDNLLTGNCAALTTEKLSAHSVYAATIPFTRLMEMSMHGVGVGFDTRGAGNLVIHKPGPDEITEIIEDTREAWAKSLGSILESYFFNRPTVNFDYSLLRPAGAPLKRFGGTASGPEPLMKLHESIREQFKGREGERIISRDIVDLMNKIGKAVVSGGARRSALISLGSASDHDYINLKNFNLPENTVRTGPDGWAWTSNNSVHANSADDLTSLVDKIAINGEPGIIWVDTMQKYGRLVDPANNKDLRATLCNPCAEISLSDSEFCCLSELYPSNHDSYEDFQRSIKHAYMYAKAVTLMPSIWPETNEVIVRNRRIGVSLTGIVEFIEKKSWKDIKNWMDGGYNYLKALDVEYSEWLGVRESIKVSTVKPSGSTSLIASTTAGVHWPTTSGYYLRRQRFLINDPLVKGLREAGYEVEPDNNDPDQTVVVTFPTTGLDVRNEREVSIWEKAHLAVLAQKYWSDNMVSVTVSFDDKREADQIEPLLRSLQGQLKSISFLPINAQGTTYAQAPFEPIDGEIAQKMQAKIKKIDTKLLYGKGSLDGVGEKFCTTDKCELQF